MTATKLTKAAIRHNAEEMTPAQIKARIAELASTDRYLVGSDEGTHAQPRTYRLYETITGERYAVCIFAGNNGRRCTTEEAIAGTAGRMIFFGDSQTEIRKLARELRELREIVRRAARKG